jgi:NAD(P)-dependent dehydrogenase (short-subunit alcohol dehydrogenase family)
VDTLVNGAGGNHPDATTGPDRPFFDLPIEAFGKTLDLNILGTVLPCQVFGKPMAGKNSGVILNVASMNAYRPLTKIPAYSAAKSGVKNFTEWLAVHMCQEYSPGIRVNGIAPGFLLTKQNRFLLVDEKTGDMTPRGQSIINHTPMGRYGDADDLYGTVTWLLSDASKFITGITVPIDGGFSAFSGV